MAGWCGSSCERYPCVRTIQKDAQCCEDRGVRVWDFDLVAALNSLNQLRRQRFALKHSDTTAGRVCAGSAPDGLTLERLIGSNASETYRFSQRVR